MRRVAAVIVIIAAVVLAGLGTWYFLNSGTASLGAPESIIVGGPPLEQSAFIYIAEDQGYFAENGLDVVIMDDYPNGVIPINDMLNDKIDISVSAEYPLVMAGLRKEKFQMIGTIDRYQNEDIIGRRDRRVQSISDLKGKKIGIPRGTICEFFLGRFLNLHGMNLSDVTLVDVNASESVDAIADRDLDAIIYFQPHVYAIKERLGNNGVSWPAQSNQLMFTVMACRDEWAAEHPETITRFLKSLAQAERYSVDHPDEAKAIVQRRLNFSDAYMVTVWPDHQFSLSLDQSLLIAMNDEGRWAINNNLTSERTMPNFRDYIYTKGLKEVKPKSVNIR